MMRTLSPPLACLAALGVTALEAAEPVDYVRDVKPLLTKQCVSCHGATRPRAGLRLDTAAAALRGNKDGPAVLPGSGDESPLILALLGEGRGERMPLKRPPPSDAQVSTLRASLDPGAKAR